MNMPLQCLTLASGGLPSPHTSTATRPVRIPQQSVACIAGVGCHGTRNISTICLNNLTISRIGKVRTHNPCMERCWLRWTTHAVVFLLQTAVRDEHTCVLEILTLQVGATYSSLLRMYADHMHWLTTSGGLPSPHHLQTCTDTLPAGVSK